MRSFNQSVNVPTEDQEQKALIRWAQYQPLLKDLLFHIPNGGSRHKLEAVNLKRMGVKAGVPDLILPVARSGKHGLWIEVKRRKKSKISEEQNRMHALLIEQGYEVCVAYGFDEAKKFIEAYLQHDKDVT